MIKRIRNILQAMIPGIRRFLKLALFLSIITVGLPLAYAALPVYSRPESVWDFTGIVLLTYIAIQLTFRDNRCTFFED